MIDFALRAAQGIGKGATLCCSSLEAIAARQRPVPTLTDEARRAMRESFTALRVAADTGSPIYGLTTGFGPLVRYQASENATDQGVGLINHLAAGFGPPVPAPIVRAMILLRLHTLGQGCSGIDPRAVSALSDILDAGIDPYVPQVGSVGASGDLIPLAHVARVLVGQGEVLDGARRVPAADALLRRGLAPVELSGRDALAIVNGTTYMTAYSALALARAQRLLEWSCRVTGWIYRLLGARAQALDPRLHAARGHAGQARAAALIRDEAGSRGLWEDATRPLQEVYSIRCAPQIIGAAMDQIDHARTLIEREMNGINDNPLIDSESCHVIHGGNFQGQQIAFAADALNVALVQTAALIERQIDVLVNPELNGGAPLMLAWQPGATSGVAGAQITATALLAEMRHHQGPCATASIPTNGRNQDIVSMGAMAARQAWDQTERLAAILSIHSIAASQLSFLRREGRAAGNPVPPIDGLPRIEGIREDRALFPDIERLTPYWLAPSAGSAHRCS